MATNEGVISSATAMAGAHVPHAKYERLIARAKELPAVATVVAHPCDETSLRGAVEAADAGIIAPILVGPVAKITAVLGRTCSTSAASKLSTRLTATPRRIRRFSSSARAKASS